MNAKVCMLRTRVEVIPSKGLLLSACLLLILLGGATPCTAHQYNTTTKFTVDIDFENTTICGYSDTTRTVVYDRMRGDLVVQHKNYPALLAKLMLDNEANYVGLENDLYNRTSIYRGYVQYRGDRAMWTLGKQRIPLGVGRVWNPIDIFNPLDSQRIEPEERIGSESLRWEYAVGDLSNLDATVARDKMALRLKDYLENADVALVGLWDDRVAQDILGWELEGQLLDTGLELRSEGGSFGDHKTNERSTRFIVGAEYGFANSLNLLAEYKFDDNAASDYLAMMASCQLQVLWYCRLLAVLNLDDASSFVAPTVEYSLSDEMTLSFGAFLYSHGDGEFASSPDRYFLTWFVHF